MARLQRLLPSGRRLLTRELATGELPRLPDTLAAEHARPFERVIELERFDALVSALIDSSEAHSSTLDRQAAPDLHRSLRLTRREAADPNLWRWLAIVHRPEFIRHRWEFQSWTTMRDRFWRSGTRHDSNSFSRLWWIAELTHEGEDYSLTERALRTQALAIGVFIRRFAHYPPALRACVSVLEDAPQQVVELCLRRFNARLALYPLEGRSEAELIEDLAELADLAWDEQALT